MKDPELFADNNDKELIIPAGQIETTKKSVYWDIQPSWQRNTFMNFITGSRGLGKTFGALLQAYYDWKATGNTFVYVRRNSMDISKVGAKLFDKHLEYGFIHELISYRRGTYYICKYSTPTTSIKDTSPDDWVPLCYVVPLSLYLKYKSTVFAKAKTIIFDEFVEESGKYNDNEVEALLSLIETVFRGDDDLTRVYCLANGFTIYNPYFLYFGIQPDRSSKTGITYFKDKSILIEEVDAEAFIREKRANTRFGRLIENTTYGDFMLGNKNIGDDFKNVQDFKEEKYVKTPVGKIIIGNDFYNVFSVQNTTKKNDILSRTMIKASKSKVIDDNTVNLTNNLMAGVPLAVNNSRMMLNILAAKRLGELYFGDSKTAAMLREVF